MRDSLFQSYCLVVLFFYALTIYVVEQNRKESETKVSPVATAVAEPGSVLVRWDMRPWGTYRVDVLLEGNGKTNPVTCDDEKCTVQFPVAEGEQYNVVIIADGYSVYKFPVNTRPNKIEVFFEDGDIRQPGFLAWLPGAQTPETYLLKQDRQ